MMMRLLTTILFTVLLASCAEKKTTAAGFKVTLGAAALSSSNANGGLILWGFNKTNQDRFSKILTPPFSNLVLELKNGMWDFSAVSWHKPSGATLNLSGTVKCAVSLNVAVQGVDVTVPIDLSNDNCVHPHLGNNASDTNVANRFVYNNGVVNQFSPIKLFACGHFNIIDSAVNGSVTINDNNCSNLDDVALIFDENLNTEVQFKPYYKIKLIEYFKPGPGQHSIGPNTISSGCLGGGSNGYSTTGAVAVLKQAWAIAETASATNVVNIPWGGLGRGMATKIEVFSDAACSVKKGDSIYFDGLLQTIGSKIDKITKIGSGNLGNVFLAANFQGAGYTPFWSILPNIKCFNSTNLTSCLPYDNFSNKLYAGEVSNSSMYGPIIVNGSYNSNSQCVIGSISPVLPAGVSLGAATFSLPGGGPNGGGICTFNLIINHGATLDNTTRSIPVTFSQSQNSPENVLSNINLPLNLTRDISVAAPSPSSSDCSVSQISNWSGVLNQQPIVTNIDFDAINKRCNFKLLNVSENSGPTSSWSTGIYPEFSVTWTGAGGTTNHYFTFNSSLSSDTDKRNSVIEIKRRAHELIGYGDAYSNQKEPYQQTSLWHGNDQWNGILLDLKKMLGASEIGGFLGKKFKTCSQLLNAIDTNLTFNFVDESNNLVNQRIEIKQGSVQRAPFQSGSSYFPLRIELYSNNLLEMILETDCNVTSNPIYYFEEMRDETEGFEDSRKHRKYFIKAQPRSLTSSGYNTSSGDIEIEAIEMVERINSDNFFSKQNIVSKISLETFSGSKLIKMNSVLSFRDSKKIAPGSYNHSFRTMRMGGTIVPISTGTASLFFDVLQDSVNDGYFTFPITLDAPTDNNDLDRHQVTSITNSDVAVIDQCTKLATFSKNSCSPPILSSNGLNNVFSISSFSYGNPAISIPLNHEFVSDDDENNNSDLENYFFPDFN